MYHSAVAKRIPDSIREKTGRVFHSTQPDVFMSMAVPVFAKIAINLGYYVSVTGQSEGSNSGCARRPARLDCFDRFIQEYRDYKIHPTLCPEIPFGFNLTPDTLLRAMDTFPDFYGGMKLNYDAMWAFLFRDNSLAVRYNLSRLDIIRKRRQIGRYHAFHMGRFLLYSAFHQSLAVGRRMLARILSFRRLAPPAPDNIHDFVKMLSGPNSVHHGLGE
jgi:hypothetical protein